MISEYSGDYNELLYLRARYYMPGTGRFLTNDKWGGDIQTPLSFNAWNYSYSNPINYSDPSGYCAGFKGLDAPVQTLLSFTAPFMLNGEHWRATGRAWKDAWATCMSSFQKAGAAFQRGDYGRSYLYASGIAASIHQAGQRVGQINREMDVLWCEDASLGDKIVAGLDVGLWSIGVASFAIPFAYEGWLAARGALSNKFLSGLSIGVPDEFMSPYATGQWRNWADHDVAAKLLLEEGLGSPNATSYIDTILSASLTNRGGSTMMVGRYPYYLEHGTPAGYTTFNMPESVWNYFNNARLTASGELNPYVWSVNQRALQVANDTGQDFMAVMLEGEVNGVYTQAELNYLVNNASHTRLPLGSIYSDNGKNLLLSILYRLTH